MDKRRKDKVENEEDIYINDEYNETTLLAEEDYNETTLLTEDYNETTLLIDDDYNETTLLTDDDYSETTLLEEDYNETTLLSEDDFQGTTLLSENEDIPKTANQAFLSNIISQEKVKITKTPFTIGSANVGVDFYVSNPAVSRKHSKIIFNKNEYFIIDNNSTNHTIIDGTVIEPNKAVKLYNGALIELADELFEFNIIKN